MSEYRNISDEQLMKIARERVYVKRGYRYSFAAFLVVSAALVGIYYLTGQGYPWFVWPIGVFALFMVSHTIGTIRSLRSIDGKPDATQREAARLRRRGGPRRDPYHRNKDR